MKKIHFAVLLSLVVCALLVSWYFGLWPKHLAGPGQLPFVLERFEPDEKPSRNSGIWEKRGGQISADRISQDQQGTVLRLAYNVEKDGGKFKEAGWWCSLSGMDLRGYSALSFRIFRTAPGTSFQIGIKNVEWLEQKISVDPYMPKSAAAGQWQEVSVPLHDFRKIDNWTAMDNFSITFRSDIGSAPNSKVFFDDFMLIPGPKAVPVISTILVSAPYPLPVNPASLPTEKLLDLVQHAAFNYFLEEVNPSNGLVKDFCRVRNPDHLPVASSAAVGFSLSSLCVGASRGWISDEFAQRRIRTTLQFYRDEAQQEHGFFYHFLDLETGKRWEESEVSSIDTALLLAGMLTAAHYYPGTEIEKTAREIYERVDWQWMLNGGKTLSMGWTPEEGFLQIRWSDYCELMIIYLLAIGSPTHPIPQDSWYQWSRLRNDYGKENFIACPPLFTHQYSHIWVDFRGMRDEEADYFQNSVSATRANKEWCQAHQEKYLTYREGFWGLTACDGPTGYMAYGAPYGVDDGTVAPTAAIGSIVFTPRESIAMIRLMLGQQRRKLWGRFGFVDAFNLEKGWFSNKYIAIDEGPIILMIENYRTGLIWKTFTKEPAIQRALQACGFEHNRPVPTETISPANSPAS